MAQPLEIVFADRPELRKVVYEKYPLTKKERKGCFREKVNNDWLRLNYLKDIIEKERAAKKEYP